MSVTITRSRLSCPAAAKTFRTLAALVFAALALGLTRCACADPASPTAYVIGPDDVLGVSVTNHEDLNTTVTVQQNGDITFPEIGDITAAGKTPTELAGVIKTGLERTRNKVEVHVTVKDPLSMRVRVLGGVRSSGSYELKYNWRLFDLVVAAGGLGQKPSQVSGRIIRHGSDSISLDVEQAVTRPESAANILLERDDLVLLDDVESAREQVYVMGQVGKPGPCEVTASTTILSLLAQAGNPTDRAMLGGAYVLRHGKQLPLDLRPTFRGKSDPSIAEFRLASGDVLFIPMVEKRYAVAGQGGRFAYFPFPESGSITVLDALSASGGAAGSGGAGGNTAKSVILRKVNGKTTLIPVNIDQMLKKGDLAKNVNLQPDDILYIPSKSDKRFLSSLQDVVTPLSLLSLIAGFHL